MKTKILFTILTICYSCTIFSQTHSIIPFYKKGIEIVEDVEDNGFEVVRTEYGILSKNDPQESIRRSLVSDYIYMILVYADHGIADLEIILEENDEVVDKSSNYDYLIALYTGETEKEILDKYAMLLIEPKETGNHIIHINSKEFEANNHAGRYCLIVGHTLPDATSDEISFSSNSMQDYKTKKNKYDWGQVKYIKSIIEIDTNSKQLSIENASHSKVYDVISSREGLNEDHIIMSARDAYGNAHTIELNGSTLDVYHREKRNKYAGIRYKLDGKN